MQSPSQKVRQALLRYFQQQLELYGDGFVLPRESFSRLVQNLNQLDFVRKESPRMHSEPQPGVAPDWKAKILLDFYNEIKDCQKCPLGRLRKNFVFGTGNPDADLMLIGEAPGRDEDEQGEPFVGRAGQLLNKILKAINFEREDVYIANILKCRPPNNRDPLPEEVAQCEPYLHRQIEIIQPKLILALGRVAGQTLLKTKASLGNLRGRLHDYRGIPMIVTFHPAALLRNPQWKYPTWDDVQYARRVFDAIQAGRPPESVEYIANLAKRK
ncbi:MAG TPA: uracil-DNA glycosylase [Bacteroidetes bacterium]|nr:uracil-DNA glycosylase [Bacteroidota bacterium]